MAICSRWLDDADGSAGGITWWMIFDFAPCDSQQVCERQKNGYKYREALKLLFDEPKEVRDESGFKQ
jgi:hypothetical protein